MPGIGIGALQVELRTEGAICRLILRGALEATSIAALEAQIDQIGCSPWDVVVVDTQELRLIDRVGARVLLGLSHYVEARGARFEVVGATAAVAGAVGDSALGTSRPTPAPGRGLLPAG